MKTSSNAFEKYFRTFLAATLIVLLPAAVKAQTVGGCDANHNCMAWTYHSAECIDPDSGLLVNYVLTGDFTLTYNDGTVQYFPAYTVNNSSTGYGPDGGVLCGPDTQSTATALASDGSGTYIVVVSFAVARVYDVNNNLVWYIYE